MLTTPLIAGDSFLKTWQFFQADGVTPVDLTGCTLIFAVAPLTQGGSVLQVASTDENPEITAPLPTNGTATLILSSTSTKTLVPNLYTSAIKVLFPSGTEFTYDQENLRVFRAIIDV